MDSRRQKKVSSAIQQAMSEVFQKHGPDFYGRAFVTITNTTVTPDLAIARFYLSVYNVENKEEIIDRLNNQVGEIRRKFGNKVRNQLRVVPSLEFYLDDTLDEVFRIEQLLKENRSPDKEGE